MPRVTGAGGPAAPEAGVSWEQVIVERLRSKKLAPIVGSRVQNDILLGGHDALVDSYIDYCRRYNFAIERRTLPEMLQIRSVTDLRMADPLRIKEDYVNFLKNRLMDLAEADPANREPMQRRRLDEVIEKFDNLEFPQFAAELGYPRFDAVQPDSLQLLADLDLPIYLTTCYHDGLETALSRNPRKQVQTDFCRWHDKLKDLPSPLRDKSYTPAPEEPLVYHLYGVDRWVDSLVLTEDDYMKFLVAVSQNVGRTSDPVHLRLRRALSDSSLLLLGYSMYEWEFRSLFWGLIAQRPSHDLQSVVTVVLETKGRDTTLEQQYLQKYLEVYKFKVYWGDSQSYLETLHQSRDE
jgi:hypothetical protein